MKTSICLVNQCISLTKIGGNICNVQNQLKGLISIIPNSKMYDDIFSLHCHRNYSFTSYDKCWSCQKENGRTILFFCNSCGIIQDPPDNDINYFNVLSVNKKFSINTIELTKKFRQLQNMVHPDKYGNRNEREQTNSQEWSSILNKAYKTLLIPMERAQYLLKLNGYSIPEENSSLDKTFLMEMMERNEEIEDADVNNITELLEKVQQDLNNETANLNNYFDSDDFEKVKYILVKMKYLKSLEKSIKTKVEKFRDVA